MLAPGGSSKKNSIINNTRKELTYERPVMKRAVNSKGNGVYFSLVPLRRPNTARNEKRTKAVWLNEKLPHHI